MRRTVWMLASLIGGFAYAADTPTNMRPKKKGAAAKK